MKRDRHSFNRKRQSRRRQTAFDRWVENMEKDPAFKHDLHMEILDLQRARQNWREWETINCPKWGETFH